MQLVLVREATLHYRSEGFCRSTVIPSEGVSPTRNLLLPTRNGGDCTLAWREILQGKAFQNDKSDVISNVCEESLSVTYVVMLFCY